MAVDSLQNIQFQSTLSVRRATLPATVRHSRTWSISIHALREESDAI